jgi:hypothetical protein
LFLKQTQVMRHSLKQNPLYSSDSIQAIRRFLLESKTMKLHVGPMLRSLFVALLFCISALPSLAEETSKTYKLITHFNVPNAELNLTQVKAIFFKRINYWQDGTPITLVTLKSDLPEQEIFCREILHTLEYKLDSAWRRAVFSGQANAPIQVDNFTSLIEKVASTPGAIGFMPSLQQDSRVKPLVVKGLVP